MNAIVKALPWPARVSICEIGLGYGLECENKIFTVKQQIEAINQCGRAGVEFLEIGNLSSMTITSQGMNTGLITSNINRANEVVYCATATDESGMAVANALGIKEIRILVNYNCHLKSKTVQVCDHSDGQRGLYQCLNYAVQNNISIRATLEAAFGCLPGQWSDLDKIVAGVKTLSAFGVKAFCLSDTTGSANPQQVYEYCMELLSLFPDVEWWLQLNNRRNMGLANVMSGMLAGIRNYETALSSFACQSADEQRKNIVASEDFVYMCQVMGIESGYTLESVMNLVEQSRKSQC